MIKQLRKNTALVLEDQADLLFYLNEDLIWHNSNYMYLYIPELVIRDILKMEHNNIVYSSFS